MTVVNDEKQDLKEYFRRPTLVATGTMGSGSNAPYLNTPVNMGTIFSTYFPSGLSRLAGVYAVRFKMVYTLQVATTPFHQGVVCMNWQYNAGFNAYARQMSSATCTHIPHVRLDLAQDTMVQLHIPFMYPAEALPLSGTTLNYGFIGINPIVRIGSAAAITDPTYKLYVHLEDLELYGAVPQSGTNLITLQSGRKKPVDEEFENDAYPLSSGLHAGSRVFKWIAKGVPMLSSLAGTPEWFLGKAAALARFYGYAKPQIQDPIVRMTNMSTVAECNVDIPSSTVMCAPFASSALRVDGTFSGSDVDEMSLAYVLSQPSQVCRFLFTTATATNAVLYATPVSPAAFWFRAFSTLPACNVNPPALATTGTFCFFPTNLFYFASMFRNWRGGLRFRFTFGKTKFHAGRVLVTYVPTPTEELDVKDAPYTVKAVLPDTQLTGLNPFGYSAIFDLKDTNVFTFDVPFVSPRPWASFKESTGSLTMCVTDPLLCPT